MRLLAGGIPGSRLAFFLLNAVINLFAVNLDVLGRINSNPHLIALYTENGHGDVITDNQVFTYSAR